MRPLRLSNLLVIVFSASCLTACSAFMSGYNESISKGHEVMLRQDLQAMRDAINGYAAQKGRLPQSLDDLAKAGYLNEIPDDPMTGKKDWKVEIGEDSKLAKGTKGIVNVHSLSSAKSSEGKPYNEW